MNAKEFRIGNFLERDDEVFAANAYTLLLLERGDIEVNKILITEEWMQKLGGKRDEFNDLFIHEDETYDIRLYLTNGFIQRCKGHCCTLSNFEHIKYIHLLQNLFFDHTAKELELKQ